MPKLLNSKEKYMANIINLSAETGANYIGDDPQPSVSFANSSTGPGLAIDRASITGGATVVTATAGAPAITASKTVISAPTVGVIAALTSGASLPIIQLNGSGFASLTTIKFITGGVAGTFAFRVVNGDGTVLGWVPILPDAAVTAIAI